MSLVSGGIAGFTPFSTSFETAGEGVVLRSDREGGSYVVQQEERQHTEQPRHPRVTPRTAWSPTQFVAGIIGLILIVMGGVALARILPTNSLTADRVWHRAHGADGDHHPRRRWFYTVIGTVSAITGMISLTIVSRR